MKTHLHDNNKNVFLIEMDKELLKDKKRVEEIKYQFRVIGKHLFDVSRDNARTPMQWDDSTYFGFSKVKPWLMGTDDNKDRNAKEAIKDEDSLFHFYQEMINLRKTYPSLIEGKFELLYKSNPHLFIYKRSLKEEEILVICSFFKKNSKWPIKDLSNYKLLLNNYKNHHHYHWLSCLILYWLPGLWKRYYC